MNADLYMADGLPNTGKGNLVAIIRQTPTSESCWRDGEDRETGRIHVNVHRVDVFPPSTAEI